MLIWENGKVREMTVEEIAEIEAQTQDAEREYWQNVPYNEAVQNEIHKKYTLDQEIALLRQQKEKPIEYAEYFVYCEQCKDFVKQKKGL